MRKRGSAFSALGGAIDGALKDNAIEKAIVPHRAVTLWAEAVGPGLAEASDAEVVRAGVLFVRARSAVWANELTFYKAQILQDINKRLGGKVISDIHFKAGGFGRTPRRVREAPATPRPTEEDLQGQPPSAGGEIPETPEEHVQRTLARAARAQQWKRAQGWIACERCHSLYPPDESATRSPGLCPLCSLRAGPAGALP